MSKNPGSKKLRMVKFLSVHFQILFLGPILSTRIFLVMENAQMRKVFKQNWLIIVIFLKKNLLGPKNQAVCKSFYLIVMFSKEKVCNIWQNFYQNIKISN